MQKTESYDIRAFRKRHEITQADLANAVGVYGDGKTVRRWEKGETPKTVVILCNLIDEFPAVRQKLLGK